MSREKQKLECEMAEMLEIIEKAREIYANDITDHTENEYIREGLLDAGYRKSEWISVDERLPEEGGTYLIVLKEKYEFEKEWRYHVDVASFTFDWDCIFHDWDEGQGIHITHWMPLPEAPKVKGGAE